MSEQNEQAGERRAGVAVLTAGGAHPWIIVNALGERFGPISVILEEPEPRSMFLKRRVRRAGLVSTAGQFATMIWIKALKRLAKRRIAAFERARRLEPQPRPEHPVTRIASANGPDLAAALERIRPDALLLAGCRMLTPETLARIPCPVLNYHAGITPAYRGMNGGYWALASGDGENFGVTVHRVDAGVDTGAALVRKRGAPAKGDTIATYAHSMADLGRGACVEALEKVLAGNSVAESPAAGPSRQWFHPPIWLYFWNGLRRGIWALPLLGVVDFMEL